MQQRLELRDEESKVRKLKLTKQKKSKRKDKLEQSIRDKSTRTAENAFARLEDVADNEVDGKSAHGPAQGI